MWRRAARSGVWTILGDELLSGLNIVTRDSLVGEVREAAGLGMETVTVVRTRLRHGFLEEWFAGVHPDVSSLRSAWRGHLTWA